MRENNDDVWKELEKAESVISPTTPTTIDLRNAINEVTAPVKPVDDLWRHMGSPTSDYQNTSLESYKSSDSFGYKSDYDLEQQEQEIIANLEREEAERMNREASHKPSPSLPEFRAEFRVEPSSKPTEKQDKIRAWKSMEFLKTSNYSLPGDSEVTYQASRDMETSMMPKQSRIVPLRSSHAVFNDQERLRMERWEEEQENKRQVDKY